MPTNPEPDLTPHTRGPWEIHRRENGYAYLHAPHDPHEWRDFARVVVEMDDTGPSNEGAANAHLIAAAPDLLEALEEVVRKFDVAPDAVKNVPLGIMKARAAIAKARGEQAHD